MMNLDRELLFRFFNKETTLEEEKKIRLWIDECDEHRREFFRERQLFDAILLHGDPSYEKSRPRFYIPWHKVVATLSGIAAIVILTIITTTYFLQQSFRDEVMNTVTVPQGQRVHLTLSDGTKVWLNAKTKMEYPQSFKVSDQRIVKVDGEAYFEVSHDKHAPFIVNSKQIKTCVLGTKFNVRARQDENRVVTTLLQGLVRVDSPRTEENGYLLKPGQTLNVNTDTYQAELIEYNQPTDVLLWINGKLEFKQQSLLEITNIMEKLYDIKFIYKDETLKSERFTGEFSTDNLPDEILNVLMHTNHFSYKKEGRIIRLSKK